MFAVVLRLKPYMSPELFNGAKFGTAVDMWATGVVAYELVMGVLPFAGGGKSRTAPRGSGGSVSTDSSGSIVTGCGSGPGSSFRNSNSSSRGASPRPASSCASSDRDGLRREKRARKEAKKTWRERVRADIINGEYTVDDYAVGHQGRRFIEKVSGLVEVHWDTRPPGAGGSGCVSFAGLKPSAMVGICFCVLERRAELPRLKLGWCANHDPRWCFGQNGRPGHCQSLVAPTTGLFARPVGMPSHGGVVRGMGAAARIH